MANESRLNKTLLNARVNLIFYFLTLCLSFFSRKIFLSCLGVDFVGLTGTLQTLLGFLNLAELGIGSAIGYVLYKPLFDHDQTKINEIISVMGYLYRWIGFIILGAGCVLACFLPLIFLETGFNLLLIYAAYFAFLGSSLIGYFINYRQNLLGADQRNYVVTAYFQSATILKTVIQMVLAYYTANLYLWVLIEFSFGIIYSVILNWKINQTYPWLKTEIKAGKKLLQKYPLIIKNTKKIFLHKIGLTTQFQAAPILIYSFSALSMVAFYTNYTTVIDKLVQLINNFLGSSEAAVGNLIAEGNKQKIQGVFWEFVSLRFWICGGVIFLMYTLLPSFITLWLGEEYLLSSAILMLIITNYSISILQNVIGQFTYGYGLFDDVWATLTSAAIYIGMSLLLGPFLGLIGVILASIISLVFLYLGWKPYYLFKYGFKVPVWMFWQKWILLAFYIGAAVYVAHLLGHMMMGCFHFSSAYCAFIVHSLFSLVLYALLSAFIMYSMSKDFRRLVSRFVSVQKCSLTK